MLDTVDCLHAATEKLCQILGCQDRHGFPFELGTMIEVPSAALQVQEILPLVDSIAIGLNDLTQYLLAADRDDELVEGYHDALQPTVLRLTRDVVQAAGQAGKPVTVCGELAGDPTMTEPLLALGVRRLSVSQSMFRDVAKVIQRASVQASAELAAAMLRLSSGAAVRELLAKHLNRWA
jgi:phosphotransferase system enzyme I (PtsI)